MKAFINVGCNGQMLKGITLCGGTENQIADLRRLSVGKEATLEYLEKHIKLFDAPAVDVNKITGVVGHLAGEGIIIPQKEKAIYKYITLHRACGLYMYVDPISPTVVVEEVENAE